MKLLVICGPTASGKSALAIECAKRLNGEIVSSDALLVYRGLDIGTAKPSKEEMERIPHHLIDVAEPSETFSVSDYERLALSAIEEIQKRGKVPILCGGTGFYLNAVLFPQSFGNVPKDDSLREKLLLFAEENGREALFERLKKVDPLSAEKLHYNDLKRVVRALEIYELTGKKKSEQKDGKIPRYPYSAFAFRYPREELYRRIEKRVEEMLQAGLVGEVRSLLERGISENAQCMQGIGYKEVVEYLKKMGLHSTMSDITSPEYREMADKIKQNTRNYAKRQITFFKKSDLVWLEPKPIAKAAEEVLTIYGNS